MNLWKEYRDYVLDNPEGYWFKRKLYGWGWTPVKWQGWVVLAVFAFAIAFNFSRIDTQSHSVSDTLINFVPQTFVLVLILIGICYKKGEKPRWQWGKSKIYKGTIVENSLADKSILEKLQVTKTWQDGDWTLHKVLINEDQFDDVAEPLSAGPWYVHFWQDESDEIFVVFKDKRFKISKSDKFSWSDAIEYGKSIGIPEEQLDFIVN